jgi:hypothetical protein
MNLLFNELIKEIKKVQNYFQIPRLFQLDFFELRTLFLNFIDSIQNRSWKNIKKSFYRSIMASQIYKRGIATAMARMGAGSAAGGHSGG